MLTMYLTDKHRQTHKNHCVIQSCFKVEQLIRLSSFYQPDIFLLSLDPLPISPLLTSSPGLLEDERLASAHQAEAFTRQIQNIQGIDVIKPSAVSLHSLTKPDNNNEHFYCSKSDGKRLKYQDQSNLFTHYIFFCFQLRGSLLIFPCKLQ